MVKRSVRSRVLELLHALNFFYSLRDLEEVLGVPFQSLWRYVNLLSVPEEKTTEKILSKIQELNLVEGAVRKALSDADVEIWSLAREPSFLRLFSLIIEELVEKEGVEVDVVVPLSEYAIPLASVVSMELERTLCPVMTCNVKNEREGFYVSHYTSYRDGELRVIAMPKRGLQGKESALMLDIVLEDPNYVEAVSGIMRRAKVDKQSLIAIQLSREAYLRLTDNKLGIRMLKVFNIV
jgi:adenine/guanine phosphoribosyltransferase-like PRPP-binding protein